MIKRIQVEEVIIGTVAFAISFMLLPWVRALIIPYLNMVFVTDAIIYLSIFLIYRFGLLKLVSSVFYKLSYKLIR